MYTLLYRNVPPNLDRTLQARNVFKVLVPILSDHDLTMPPIEPSRDNYLAHDGAEN
ncbi:hypothetical protein PILCRDRAFT_819410 [Piloderma croceum F 1598]|uniref:Uncharacterized protein n=1 Tax=Piloderma croceum (strain F 1598) TaxID=765440 RepID=A0A0C3FFE9_PILCF|nr:hypothetical protein PILCRDRAFT_819410 [Piloderma croceum F 1598]